MKKVLLLAGLLAIGGCTDPATATKVLTQNGFKHITYSGYGFMACSEDDFCATEFKATSSTGARVSGTVCSGLFKGSTLRFD